MSDELAKEEKKEEAKPEDKKPVAKKRPQGVNINSMTNGPNTAPPVPTVGAPPPKSVIKSPRLKKCHEILLEIQEDEAAKPDKNRALQISYLKSSIKCGCATPENK